MSDTEDLRDALPDDLNATEYVGPYRFPDNSRRRRPAYLYFGIAAVCFLMWLWRRGGDPVLINGGMIWAAVLLSVAGVMSFTSGWKMNVDEKEALVAATRHIGIPVGHASAQLCWRGLLSRPAWRILCYSADTPPTKRGFVLVDAVDGAIVGEIIEDNPEDWAEFGPNP